jgi:hypothetical protein
MQSSFFLINHVLLSSRVLLPCSICSQEQSREVYWSGVPFWENYVFFLKVFSICKMRFVWVEQDSCLFFKFCISEKTGILQGCFWDSVNILLEFYCILRYFIYKYLIYFLKLQWKAHAIQWTMMNINVLESM